MGVDIYLLICYNIDDGLGDVRFRFVPCRTSLFLFGLLDFEICEDFKKCGANGESYFHGGYLLSLPDTNILSYAMRIIKTE